MKRFFLKKKIAALGFMLILLAVPVTLLLLDEPMVMTAIKNLKLEDWRQVPQELQTQWQKTELYEGLKGGYGRVLHRLDKKQTGAFNYIREDNGFIYAGSFLKPKNDELLDYAKSLRKLQSSSAGPIIFISPPQKDSRVLVELEDREMIKQTDAIQDEFLLYLSYVQVDTLDLRDRFGASGRSYEQLYYKTDEAFTTLAAFESAGAIVEKLNRNYQENLDPYYTDLANYQVSVYEDQMVGSSGTVVGSSYAGFDDFTLLTPAFETAYQWEYVTENSKEQRSGTFATALINDENLSLEKGLIKNPMGVYLNGMNDFDKIINPRNPEGLKILCIRDEWFSPVAAFLMPYCSEIVLVSSANSEFDIAAYISENQFDYIFVEYIPKNITAASFIF